MGMEFKSFGFKIDDSSRDETREQRLIKGYGSTFENAENADCYGDIVLPGAFDATIAEDFPAGRVKLFGMHWQPIGMPLVLRADAKGLYIEARISKTRDGDDALELALDGVLAELSIGFEPKDYDFILVGGKEIRRLKRIKLYEVSLVPWGANPYAQVTEAIKSFGRAMEIREGRVLSKANFDLLLRARDSLDSVINSAAPKDDEGKGLVPAGRNLALPAGQLADREAPREDVGLLLPPHREPVYTALSEQLKQLQALIKA